MLHVHSSHIYINQLQGLSINYLLTLQNVVSLSVDVATSDTTKVATSELRELLSYAQANGMVELLFSSEGEYIDALGLL